MGVADGLLESVCGGLYSSVVWCTIVGIYCRVKDFTEQCDVVYNRWYHLSKNLLVFPN